MFSLRTFGSQGLSDASESEAAAVLSQPKRFALLVYLAAARPRGMHRRDTLLTLFWPERDQAHARNALSQGLSFLRKNLSEDLILGRGTEEVGLDPGLIRVDAQEFEIAISEGRWAEALKLYRGDFLRGFHLGKAWGFEEWLEGERERHREAAAGAAWSLSREQVGRGALLEAERTAQRAMDLVCTDESAARGFIEALARAGDRASALNFYERVSSRLRETLDLDPSPETKAVALGIRNGTLGKPPDSPGAGTEGGREREGVEETAQVRRSSVSESLDVEEEPPGERRPLSAKPKPELLGRRPGLRLWFFGWMVLLAAAVAVGFWIWPGGGSDLNPRLVAVVPFQNRTRDPALDALGARVASEIQLKLHQAGFAETVPQPVVEQLLLDEGPTADPLEILPKALGAGVVVTGDLFIQGDSLLVRAYSVNSETGEGLHPIPPAKGLRTDVAGPTGEVRDRVAAALVQHFDTVFGMKLELTPPPRTLEAYQEYRRAFEVYKLGGSHQDALDLFGRAWEMDPEYLAPVLRLFALSSSRPGMEASFDSIHGFLESNRARMTRFQRHYYDGVRLSANGEQELAYREFKAMSELGPFHSASALAEMCFLTNRMEESAEAAGWLDLGDGDFREPFVTFWQGYWSHYTYALHLTGQYEKELEIALEWGRRFPAASFYPVQAQAKALAGLGRISALDPILQDWRAERRLSGIWGLADELWIHGHGEAARTVLEEEVARFETDSAYIGRYNNQAMVLHRLGRDREAHLLWEAEVDLEKPDLWEWGVGRIGFSAALTGDSAQAREMDRILLVQPEPQERYTPFLRAQIAAALGEKARAVRILQEWAEAGTVLFWVNNLHRDFTLQSLLGDFPPFQELLRSKG